MGCGSTKQSKLSSNDADVSNHDNHTHSTPPPPPTVVSSSPALVTTQKDSKLSQRQSVDLVNNCQVTKKESENPASLSVDLPNEFVHPVTSAQKHEESPSNCVDAGANDSKQLSNMDRSVSHNSNKGSAATINGLCENEPKADECLQKNAENAVNDSAASEAEMASKEDAELLAVQQKQESFNAALRLSCLLLKPEGILQYCNDSVWKLQLSKSLPHHMEGKLAEVYKALPNLEVNYILTCTE